MALDQAADPTGAVHLLRLIDLGVKIPQLGHEGRKEPIVLFWVIVNFVTGLPHYVGNTPLSAMNTTALKI